MVSSSKTRALLPDAKLLQLFQLALPHAQREPVR